MCSFVLSTGLTACGSSGTLIDDEVGTPDAAARVPFHPVATDAGPADDSSRTADTNVDATAPAGDASVPGTWAFTTKIITDQHRAIPGVMFGGWGPHLGHLVRVGRELYWVDDACARGTCNVNVNARVDYYRVTDDAMTKVATVSLPGTVQQNTGTVASDDRIFTYGLDVAGKQYIECGFKPPNGTPACSAIAVDVGVDANYLGAAIHPKGSRLLWHTNVKDGGGGTFRFYANYGGGWNGPRTGPLNGYNDASYINVAFADRETPSTFFMHAELVTGLAPNWTFTMGLGTGSLAGANAVAWSVPLSVKADPSATTNDIFTDPTTGDTHMLARARSGALVYHYRPKGGAFDGAEIVHKTALRARFIYSGGRLFVVHTATNDGLWVRELPLGKGRFDFTKETSTRVPVPAGYEDIYSIYPESEVYQTSPLVGVHVAVVGRKRENEILGVSITPP